MVGENEKKSGQLSVRLRKGADLGALSKDFVLNTLASASKQNIEFSEVDNTDEVSSS